VEKLPDKVPDELPCITIRKMTGCGKVYVTCTFFQLPSGVWRMVKCFFTLGKAGNCSNAFLHALAIAISDAGKQGANMKEIGRKLIGIQCPSSVPGKLDDPCRILSCPDAIGKAITQAEESWAKSWYLKSEGDRHDQDSGG
jgi:hypothetical protein